MEARQLAVLQRQAVVQPYQLHEHVGDQDAQVLDVACLVLDGHDLGVWIMRLRLRLRRGGGMLRLRLLLLVLVLLLVVIALDGGRDSGRLRGHPRLRLLWAFRGGCFCVGEGLPPLGPALV